MSTRRNPKPIDATIGTITGDLLSLANTQPPALTRRQQLNVKLSTADWKLLDTLRQHYGQSWASMVSRILWMIARTLRTGRDPYTGEKLNKPE
jgi:hypothetical protein